MFMEKIKSFNRYIAFILPILVVLKMSEEIRKLDNGLYHLIDSYSEAGSIRAGESYVDHGFLFNAGLPD
ncbi:MAG: hypothetical protein N2578_06180, partial [Bdellovibrionaceae bacterium]|nr:hypothetical protein [Pseudobdellovibrionaceae bacterium]